ncbi:MAG: type II secretion system F family protein [Vibrionaceae bacterium]
MLTFKYLARHVDGRRVTGELQAVNVDAALHMLAQQRLQPLSLTEHQTRSSSTVLFAKITRGEMAMFCRQLGGMFRAGVPVLQAIHTLWQSCSNPKLKVALQKVEQELIAGQTLSAAMAQQKKIFGDLMVAMVQVGESTGRLDTVMLTLSRHFLQEINASRQVRSAVRYPFFVFLAMIVALWLLYGQVLPVFVNLYKRNNAQLPPLTNFLLELGNAVEAHGVLAGALLVLLVACAIFWSSTASGRLSLDKLRLRLPIFGALQQRVLMGRFAQVLAMMISAGIPFIQALDLAANALDNRYLQAKMARVRVRIENGASLSESSMQEKLFLPLVQQMIQVGEQSGELDLLLEDVAHFYGQEVEYDFKSLTARVEPILLLVLSLSLLALALGIFLPIWNLADVVRAQL